VALLLLLLLLLLDDTFHRIPFLPNPHHLPPPPTTSHHRLFCSQHQLLSSDVRKRFTQHAMAQLSVGDPALRLSRTVQGKRRP
jgi:hypothetical protein